MNKAVLLLENGTFFEGESFGFDGETSGEVVFNTSMTGYQEILTDPSYAGQIVTMTYPLIGNYGINNEDTESDRIQVAGFIVREVAGIASNWRSEKSLQDYLIENRIVAIQGVDTRKLTRILRNSGAMNGILSAVDFDKVSLEQKLKQVPSMKGLDLVSGVSISEPLRYREFKEGLPHIVAIHAGIKSNILRIFSAKGANITLVPASFSAEQVMAFKPDGVFLSNGPGDPEVVATTIQTIRDLIGKIPMFGICLGHQLLSLALGAKTYKLKFGHRGGNQPVMDLMTRKVEISAQNHGFAVDPDSLPEDVKITHVNLNDRTVEGIRHKSLPIYSVQYHPEASPGPHDSHYLFDRFLEEISK